MLIMLFKLVLLFFNKAVITVDPVNKKKIWNDTSYNNNNPNISSIPFASLLAF